LELKKIVAITATISIVVLTAGFVVMWNTVSVIGTFKENVYVNVYSTRPLYGNEFGLPVGPVTGYITDSSRAIDPERTRIYVIKQRMLTGETWKEYIR
jgi:hypothetical protein